MEDPIRKFTDVGYVHLIKQFAKDEGYSYIYKGMVGCLDYALANEQMAEQVTGCEVFHINADEAAVFGYNGYSYQNNMYRSSDHDPVVVGLRLGTNTPTESIKTDDRIIYGGEGVIGVASAEGCVMEIYTLMGQKVYAEKIMSNEYTVSTAEIGLKGGIYIVKLSNGDVVKLRIEIF